MFVSLCSQRFLNTRPGWQNGLSLCLILNVIALLVALPVSAQVSPTKGRSHQSAVIRGQPAPLSLRVLVSQHRRILIERPVQRIAVGDTSIATAQLINNQELLVLGQHSGRTTIIVWLQNGQIRVYQCNVQRDLSVLHAALHTVHSSISVRSAPDRDALILTGNVPDISYAQAAEGIAQKYLQAKGSARRSSAGPLVKGPQKTSSSSHSGESSQGSTHTATTSDDAGEGGDSSAKSSDPIWMNEEVPSRGTIINLIRLQTLPPTMETRMQEAINNVGGKEVAIRRVMRGTVQNDQQDVFVLEGTVKNQVALLRVLEITSRMLTGKGATRKNIRVIGDEAGALARRVGSQGGQANFGVGGNRLFGGGGGGQNRINNRVRSNFARAKAIEAANGRIVSFIHVKELPQIRVNIKLYEVNRTKLRSYSSDLAGAWTNFGTGQLQGKGSKLLEPASTSGVQQVLGFLSGTFTTKTFLQSGEFILESAFTFLESLNLARSLSSPSLTVLSGETAAFLVGGEVPISQVASPFVGNQATPVIAGVFQTVQFREFGVSLRVRPLVGEDGELTIDVVPRVVKPDLKLTAAIESASGTNQSTTAFESRSLQTSARLHDGQSLLIGGLLSRNKSDQQNFVPGIWDIPVLRWLFRKFSQNDQELDLVVMINPVIMRETNPDVGLWAFPELSDYHPDWHTTHASTHEEDRL